MSAAYCRFAPGHAVHARYHDNEYGFPTRDETVLF
jgi:DNA-3-methyladenine glycosylase I